MIFRFLLIAFAILPTNKNKSNELKFTNADYEFNNDLNYIVTSIGFMGYFIPKLLRKREMCIIDDDCPLIMRCCKVGKQNYCCTPNNFVKMDLAYLPETINT